MVPDHISYPPESVPLERDEIYGDAVYLTGEIVQTLHAESLLRRHPTLFFSWVMILNKLIRAMYSPTIRDHWVDIMGYAELVLRRLSDDTVSSERTIHEHSGRGDAGRKSRNIR